MTNTPRRALVTGAGRGIGRGISLALAHAGFDVAVNDLTLSDDLAETVSMIEATGRRAVPVAADISDIEGHAALVDAACAAFGGIDCLVNNAGTSVKVRGDLLDSSPDSFDRLMSVNLRGTFFLTQEVARRMLAEPSEGFRSIVTISSANAAMPSPDRAEYCISKTGLSMMTQLFALRLADAGINVYEIQPGVIETAMTAVAKDRYDARFRAGFTPINRWGQPSDIGAAVAMLAGGGLAYTTGECLRVDGGLHLPEL